MAAAKAPMSSRGTTSPFTPGSTSDSTPEVSVATTGRPAAIASSTT